MKLLTDRRAIFVLKCLGLAPVWGTLLFVLYFNQVWSWWAMALGALLGPPLTLMPWFSPSSVKKRRQKKALTEPPRCVRCGYALVGLAGDRCPECGLTSPSQPAKKSHYARKFVTWSLLIFALPTLLLWLVIIFAAGRLWIEPHPVIARLVGIGVVLSVVTCVLGAFIGGIIDGVRETR